MMSPLGPGVGPRPGARAAVCDGIRAVCCCLPALKEKTPGDYAAGGITATYVMDDFHDGALGSIEPYAEAGADFVQEQIAEGNVPVLIHCSVGKTRATAVCAVFLMKHRGMTLREAMVHIRCRRHRAYPLLRFWHQLIDKEAELHGGTVSLDRDEVARLHAETVAQEQAAKGGVAFQVSQLVAMGFLEADALACLERNGGNVEAAISELLVG